MPDTPIDQIPEGDHDRVSLLIRVYVRQMERKRYRQDIVAFVLKAIGAAGALIGVYNGYIALFGA